MGDERPFDAVILAGGAASRMDGHDKTSIVFDGLTLLDRAIAACEGARAIICVGPRRSTTTSVRWTREVPPGGGPVAALAAGLAMTSASVVVCLGADMPFVTHTVVHGLLESCPVGGGAVITDSEGHKQFLSAAYDSEVLRSALSAGSPIGRSMHSLLAGLPLVEILDPQAARDVDTWEDLSAIERE